MTRRIAAVLLALVSAACRTAGSEAPPIVQPGAPGEASHVIGAGKATDLSRVQATAADVRFMQGMIHHHAQALVMARMAPAHGASPAVLTLCNRIINAQADEINFMSQWLREGRVRYREDIVEGLENAPRALIGLLNGENIGKRLVKV